MRTGLIVTAVLATALTSSTALADRYSDEGGNRRTQEIRDRVLRGEKIGYGRVERSETVRSETTSRRIESRVLNRDRGEVLDGRSRSPGASTRNVTVTPASRVPNKFMPREEMADGNKAPQRSASSGMGKQVGWSAGGKSVRSYVHFVNERGEINNNIHGSTATAMKMRNIAGVLLRTAGLFGKLFPWMGSGADASDQAF